MRLKTRFILMTAALVIFVVMLTGSLFVYVLQRSMQEQIGENALDLARSVARMPQVRAALNHPHPTELLQPLAESIRSATGASFIVIGNKDGIRYSHPEPDRIGKPMVGGDNGPALLEAREYTSIATGSLGRSIRGKVPLLDEDGEVVGIVSVGFLLPEVDRLLWTYAPTVLIVLSIGLTVSLPGAWVVASSIKKATHGLEPAEIAALAEQRNAILSTIREGIIAVDASARVVVVNETARRMVPGLIPGADLLEILPNSRLLEVLKTGKPEYDHRMLLGETAVVANRIPVRINGKVAGVVASFRDQSELERLSRELSDTRKYTEELRAQAHEFANTLQAISGMLQLHQVDEAVDFIQEIGDDHRQLVEALPRSLGDSAVAALLLGKCAVAREFHVNLTVDPASYLDGLLPESNLLVRVVGNLVDNALEAVRDRPSRDRQVRVCLTGQPDCITIRVADSGPGVPPEAVDLVFVEGYSTKATGRGVGLALVRRLVDRVGGQIGLGRAPEGGALFEVVIPRPKEA